MARTEQNIEPAEAAAAVAIGKLAEACQDAAYYHEFQGVPITIQKAILRAYRVLKQATIFYRGDDHGLVYDVPDHKFKPKGAK